MKRIAVRASLSILLVAGVLAPGAAFARPSEDPFFVVGFRELPPGLRAGGTFLGASVLRVNPVLHYARVRVADAAQFRARAAGHGRVRYVEPDPEIKLIEFTPNDPRYGEQYGPAHIRAPEAWDTTLGDLDATLCVVDTGVRYTHEEIGGRWLGGRDFYNGDADPWDDHGHGTWVTTIGAGEINNAAGIAGVGNVGIRAAKVLSSQGTGFLSTVADGIQWCADNGGPRTVISMSLGSSLGATVLQNAVTYAATKGALQVAAAGNDGPCSNCVNYPARYTEVIAVTCTDAAKNLCSFSSAGPQAELAAPGASILGGWNGSNSDYRFASGTSASTPHVSGTAALVWSHATGPTAGQLRQLLQANAADLGPSGLDSQFGHGLVDAKATLDAAAGVEPPPPPPEPPPGEGALFEDNFDGAFTGWSTSGLWHVSSACLSSPSPPNSLRFSQDAWCDYHTGKRVKGEAILEVDLSETTQATLSFRHFFYVEFYPYDAFDVMRVEVSQGAAEGSGKAKPGGGGKPPKQTWTTLAQWDSRDWTTGDWTPHSIDLGGQTGGPLQVRFSFDSVDRWNNAFPGWFVDDVKVMAG